jgi:uncharacterized protein (TIGR02118 family)
MLKVAWLVRLSRGRDRDEVLREWNEDHAAMVRRLPGVERYTHNLTLAIAEGPGAGRDAPEIDGVACTWWTDDAAFDAALRSSEWRRILEHGRQIFDPGYEHARQAAEIEERVMRLGPGTPWHGAAVAPDMCKHVGVLYFRRDLERDAARAWWANQHGSLALKVPEIAYYVQNHSVRPRRLDCAEEDGEFPFDGFSEAWFSDRETFESAHESPAWHALRDDSPNLFDLQAIEAGVNCVVAERVIKG